MFFPLYCLVLSACNISITQLNTDPPPGTPPSGPILDGGGDQIFPSHYATRDNLVTVDFNNVQPGYATDFEMSYTCRFQQFVNGVAGGASDCANLPGTASFDSTSGILLWTPGLTAFGPYVITGYGTNKVATASVSVVVDVRQPYSLTNLTCDLDAQFANFSTPISGAATSWRDLTTNGHDGTIVASVNNGTTSGWLGTGSASSPYELGDLFGAGRVDLGLNTVIGTFQNSMAFSTWITTQATNNVSSVVMGNSNTLGQGYVLKQSDLITPRLELAVGHKRYRDVVLADAPTGYWRLIDTGATTTAVDVATVAHNGTYTGGYTLGVNGLVSGDPGQAVTFDGASGYVNVADTAVLKFGAGSFSLETWANVTNANQNASLIAKRSSATATQYNMFVCGGTATGDFSDVTTGKKLCVFIFDSGAGSYRSYVSTTSYADGAIHHFLATYDAVADAIAVYVDGAAAAGTTFTSGAVPNSDHTDPLRIANASGAANFLSATFQEAAVYAYPLSSGQAKAHFDAGRNAGTGPTFYANNILSWQPKGYWRLGESAGGTAYDFSTNANDGAYSSSGVVLGNAGALGAADADTSAFFDGTNGRVVATRLSDPGANAFVTVAAWVYPTIATNLATYTVVENGLSGSFFNYGLVLSGNGVNLALMGRDTAGDCLVSGYVIPRNAWTHVAITFNGAGAAHGFINGVDTGTTCGAMQTSASAAGGNFFIGTRTTAGGEDFQGAIDEVAVFYHAASARQIAQMYSNGGFWKCLSQSKIAIGLWDYVGGIWDGTNLSLFMNGRKECAIQPGTTFTNPSSALLFGRDASGQLAWAGQVGELRLYSSGTAAAQATNFAATAPRYQTTSPGNIATSGLLLNLDAALAKRGTLPFANGCATSDLAWTDLSATQADATVEAFSACVAGTLGWSGNGTAANPYRLAFNGTFARARIPYNAALDVGAGDFTVELWTKMSTQANYQNLFARDDAGTGAGIDVYVTPTGTLRTWVTSVFADGVKTIGDGAWHHVVLVRRSGTSTQYVDGATDATFASAGSVGGSSVIIGSFQPLFPNYDSVGSVAKVAMYGRALSSSEISQNCNALKSRFAGAVCH
ncbi:MAG: hypothetical protein HY075_06460 [Deltaproteobacteria bacterium]|nr:hypothetical protein [Deltaproteobacteria bacterium]